MFVVRSSDGFLVIIGLYTCGIISMATSFAACMQFTNQSSELWAVWIQLALDWTTLPCGSTVVNSRGSKSRVLFGLAEQFPLLHYIVQDKLTISESEPQPDHVSFNTHNFFTPQSIQADVFFFKKVFNDWSEAYCDQILRALGPALRLGIKADDQRYFATRANRTKSTWHVEWIWP